MLEYEICQNSDFEQIKYFCKLLVNKEKTAVASQSHLYSVLSNHSQSDLPHFSLRMPRASKILQKLAREVKRINIDERSQVNQYLQSHDFVIKIDDQI